MAERAGAQDPKPQDPKPLRCQVVFKELSDEMLKYQQSKYLAYTHFAIMTDPAELLERLNQSTLKDRLLKPGQSLSAFPTDVQTPDLGLLVGEAPLDRVTLTHWGWYHPKWRIDPNGPQTPLYDTIEYPGEFDWAREIDISVWYGEGDNKAAQTLSVHDSSMRAGQMPTVTGFVRALRYAAQGYEGHNLRSRRFKSQKEAISFVGLARELFEKREVYS